MTRNPSFGEMPMTLESNSNNQKRQLQQPPGDLSSRRRKRQPSFFCASATQPILSAFVAPLLPVRHERLPLQTTLERKDPITRPYYMEPRQLAASASSRALVQMSASTTAAAAAASTIPPIAVSIDQPLFRIGAASLDDSISPQMILKVLPSLVPSTRVVRNAAITLCAVFFLSLVLKRLMKKASSSTSTTSSSFSEDAAGAGGNVKRFSFETVTDRLRDSIRWFRSIFTGPPTVIPMPFPEKESDGWGVCTLKSKRRLGATSFFKYDFELPEPDYVLPLELGQQISLCCLDNDNNIATGAFFPYQHERYPKTGSFSILTETPPRLNRPATLSRAEDTTDAAAAAGAGSGGAETANFVRVLKGDLRVGDEVALKPGNKRLDYKGQYLPVTDMVYIALGVGIVPVLEQARTVLPTGSSSVKSVTVAWINGDTKDFGVNADLLEKEYNRYSNKMAVSCILGDVERSSFMRDSVEINTTIPDFRPGTMAVVSGPREFAAKAVEFLEERGYPSDTICVL